MSAQIPILEELLLIHEEWVNTNEKSDMSGPVIPSFNFFMSSDAT